MLYELKIPSLGENNPSGSVQNIAVKVGDKVSAGQALMEIAMDKVTLEVPSEVDGTVAEILVKDGAQVSEGTLVARIETAAEGSGAAAPAAS
ncbi:MAG TPA: lipoyl domain-containing protein, partial [Saprospiraceae bacterium]|nr:lipoyl domain-containing protein [Saprospiraceae bacterium]